MKTSFYRIILLLLVVTFSYTTTFKQVFAAKKNISTTQSVKVINNEGDITVAGSILNPKADEVNILLPKPLLLKIRKAGLKDLSLNLTSVFDSTKTYSLPKDAISLQKKVIKKKPGQYLVVSLFNLSTQSGITVSPSALPSDDYKLRITGKELDTTTDSFTYKTPVLIVGTVDSKTTGLVSVEDLLGEKISERTVATNPNGSFFTEVRANKINQNTKARKYLEAQTKDSGTTTSSNGTEEIGTGVIHCVAGKDFFAIVPLENNPKNNTAITNNPIKVNESSTLTANLAISSAKEGDGSLAVEVAKNKLEDLASQGETGNKGGATPIEKPPQNTDLGCALGSFASRCSEDEKTLASIGVDFKKFIQSATCNFPEFKLLQNIIPKLPDSSNVFIGKGYCEHVGRQVDENKPCQIYSQVLKDFQDGKISQLPCPPTFCNEFQNIKPPKCFNPVDICGGEVPCSGPNCPSPSPDKCFHKQQRDLYCAKIGVDIKPEECKDDDFGGPVQFKPGWTIATNSKGNKYCVPSNIPKLPTPPGGFGGYQPPSTPAAIAEECEVNACHKNCENKFPHPGPVFASSAGPTSSSTPGGSTQPPKCDVCDCHFTCDADAGRVVDCGNPLSKYFSNKCCNQTGFGPQGGFGSQGGFGPGGGSQGGGFGPRPVPIDIRGCLCKDTNNFNDKGFVKEEAQNSCRNKCPEGFEKDQYSDNCLPTCPEGSTRDPGGSCRKKCPEGFTQDESGNCRCPQGQKYDPISHKCVSGQCPSEQYLDPNGACRCISDGSIPSPSGFCSQQGKICQPGEIYNPNTNPCRCATGASYGAGNICQCPGSQPYTGTGCGTFNCPPPYITNPSNNPPCKCPESTPISFSSTCVAKCPEGLTAGYPPTYGSSAPGSYTPILACLCPDKSYPDQSGKCYGSGQRYCAPSEVPTASNPCTCNPSGGSYFSSSNTCTCPSGSGQTYTVATGCGTTSTNYCSPGITVGTNGCTCNPTAGAYNSNGYCTCPTNSGPYTKEYGCTSSSQCPTATPFKCSNGSCAVSSAACTSTTNCPSPYVINPSGTPPCKCPDATPISYNATCVASCPSPLVQGTPPGSTGMPSCLCPGTLQYPSQGGQCSTANYCVAGTGPSSNPSNPCSCAPPGTPTGTNATCQCPPGSSIAYSAQGCGTISTSYCFPGITVGTNGCTCNPSGGGYNSNGYCTCPSGSSSPYTPATGCGSTLRPCTAGEGPSNNCYCFGGATVVNGTCQCPNNNPAYTGGGCNTSSTNYCSPGIVPTAANPCTCNPAGGSLFNSSGSCICPSGSTSPYTKETGCTTGSTNNFCAIGISTTTGCTCASGATPSGTNSTCQCTNGQAYAQAGCPVSTTTTCPAPYITNPNGSPPCKCPDSIPIINGSTCVAACPSPLTSQAGPSGQQTCLCPGGVSPNSNGTCSTTTRTCGAGDGPNITPSNPCTCQSLGGTTVDANGYCKCPSSAISYTAIGCRVCPVNEVYNSSNPCQCAGTATYNSQNICSCTNGGTYSESGCTPPPTITLSSVTISGSNVSISYSIDSYACLLIKNASNSTLKSGNLCGVGPFSGASFPTSDFTPAIVSGTQVKLCNQNSSSNCSNLVTVP